MRHHVFSAAIGIAMAAALVPLSATQAAAADPTGIWRKSEQGERPGKFEIYRCGSGKRYLCAKIVWLQDPLHEGKPIHDIRNENPRLRSRPILGLPIINGMAQVGANQWKGNIYNPEDGNTYSATLTLVSRNQINLRGCKGWILCGERTWLRTTLPKEEPTPEPEEQIEASAEPESAPETETAAAAPAPEEDAFANAEMLTPVAQHSTQAGYRFLSASTTTQGQAGYSGENVPSMFAMTSPLPKDGDEADAVAAAEGAPAPSEPQTAAVEQPASQPKPQPVRANAAPSPQPQAAPESASSTAAEPGAEPIEGEEPMQTAETEMQAPHKLSWRERRQLRRQQKLQQQEAQGLLPWLR
jgi:uncharacterized protein (DUF2147 family)